MLTGKTSSPPFAISRGSICPISIRGKHHHISLHADDILLYLNNPLQCIPHVLSIFEHYGRLSGVKINWQKSALLPLNQAMCNAPIRAFIPVTKNFIYQGIDIYSSIQTLPKNNVCDTLNKIVADLDRWSSLAYS